MIIRTLLKDVQKLEFSGRLKLDDFTRILKAVSESESYRNLILMKDWQEFLLKNQDQMLLANVEDIEIVLQNLDY